MYIMNFILAGTAFIFMVISIVFIVKEEEFMPYGIAGIIFFIAMIGMLILGCNSLKEEQFNAAKEELYNYTVIIDGSRYFTNEVEYEDNMISFENEEGKKIMINNADSIVIEEN